MRGSFTQCTCMTELFTALQYHFLLRVGENSDVLVNPLLYMVKCQICQTPAQKMEMSKRTLFSYLRQIRWLKRTCKTKMPTDQNTRSVASTSTTGKGKGISSCKKGYNKRKNKEKTIL